MENFNKDATIVPYLRNKILMVPTDAANSQGSLTGKIVRGHGQIREAFNIKYLLNAMRKYPEERLIFLDIGANLGSYSWLTTILPNLECHYFDPQQKVINWAKQIIKDNNIERITVHEHGLAEINGIAHFYVRPKYEGSCRRYELTKSGDIPIALFSNPNLEFFDLPVRKLDDLNIQKIDFVKIDVEGFENDVFIGGFDTFAKCQPKLFIIETKHPEYIQQTYLPNYIFSRVPKNGNEKTMTPEYYFYRSIEVKNKFEQILKAKFIIDKFMVD